jgi:hypothetical protein
MPSSIKPKKYADIESNPNAWDGALGAWLQPIGSNTEWEQIIRFAGRPIS